MATIEQLLAMESLEYKNLSDMTDEDLKIYLADITAVEPIAKQINILPKDNEEDEKEQEKQLPGDELGKLKQEAADDDSPFAKGRKAKEKAKLKKKAKFLIKDDDDPEFQQLKQELGF